MSIIESKTILFIKSPSHNMKPVEHFLQKRDFKIYSELDIKMALVKVIEINPSIIFIAWDHPNAKIFDLPKLIATATTAKVIPYVMGQAKEDYRKLDICPMEHKLYPPVSGPAVERLVLKFCKIEIRKNSDYDEIVNRYKIGKEIIDTNSKMVAASTHTPDPQIKRSEFRLQSAKSGLPEAITTELKKTLHAKIKHPIEQLLPPLSAATQTASDIKQYRAYCHAVLSPVWCGYMTLISDVELESMSIQMIMSQWLSENFPKMLEIAEHDFVPIPQLSPDLRENLLQFSDYSEKLSIESRDISVHFFSMDPSKLNFELNEEKSLIKIPTEEIPADEELKFSLHLHLPENKKFIVYVQAQKKLTIEQKKRLLANKINYMYLPLEAKDQFRTYTAESHIKLFCANAQKKKPAL